LNELAKTKIYMDVPYKSSAPAAELDKQEASTSSFLSRLIALARANDRGIALGLLVLCFVTRLIAVPASLWEWDDILFAHALHKYDLPAHHPHPPGYPVFVAMGRAVYWLVKDEHLALATVSLIFATFVAPALFYFYREIFGDRQIAFAGALLGSFAPNIWMHSGAGRSDEVGLTLGIIGLTLVIRGLRSQRSLIAGCAVFGLAMGIRTTLLPVMGLVTALAFLIRLRRREWKPVVAALMAGIIFGLVWLIPFFYYVPWDVFRAVNRAQSQYIWETDSIYAYIIHNALEFRMQRFIIEIWGSRWIMQAFYALSAMGLIALAIKRQWKVIGWIAASFIPFIIFTWTINSPLNAALYSMPYIPLFTGLAACGLIMVPRLFGLDGRWKWMKHPGLFLAILLTIAVAGWTYPAIKLLHSEVSPPVRALRYMQQNLDPKSHTIYVDPGLTPHAWFYLPEFNKVMREDQSVPESNLINPVTQGPTPIALTDISLLGGDKKEFGWTSNKRAERRLHHVSVGRYFNIYVTDMSKTRGITFLSGWYPPERDDSTTWRWMGRTAKVALLNLAESMTLRLQGAATTLQKSGPNSTFVLRLDGVEVDRFTSDGEAVDHTVVLRPDPARLWSVLSIETDHVVNRSRAQSTAEDDRDLSFQCFALEWSPAPGASIKTQSIDKFLGKGWGPLEGDQTSCWRWTYETATANLPIIDGEARLDLRMSVAPNNDGTFPDVIVEVGGNVIEKFHPPSNLFTRTIYAPNSSPRGAGAELKLSTSISNGLYQNPHSMQIYYLGWRPSERK
jgi:hypothetical protein